MTWIKTVRMDDDDRVKSAMEAQRKLYPVEYATPVHPVNDGENVRHRGEPYASPRRTLPCLQHVWRAHVARFAS